MSDIFQETNLRKNRSRGLWQTPNDDNLPFLGYYYDLSQGHISYLSIVRHYGTLM
jgi:hypothetical protein